MSAPAMSPMMRQFHAVKREHPDGLLFFRMGDFFELFYEDAERAADLLGLTLTARSKGEGAIPMAGVPVRSAEGYINRLVKMGSKVVVCDQIQDPSEAKGIVERAVTRVVTPGTVLDEEGLEEKRFNWLAAIAPSRDLYGLALADLSTGTFTVAELSPAELFDQLQAADIAECLIPESLLDASHPQAQRFASLKNQRSPLADWHFDIDAGRRRLEEHAKVRRLDGFGLGEATVALGAAGAILYYLAETQRAALLHLRPPIQRARHDRMVLDRTTRSALELVRTQRDNKREGSLLWAIDRTKTPMGARLLADWLLSPLLDLDLIVARQDAVQELCAEAEVREALVSALKAVRDIERLLSRVAVGRASARELLGLRQSLGVLPALRTQLEERWSSRLQALCSELPDLRDLVDLLQRALLDEVPLTIKEGGMIREGFDEELDELRSLSRDGQQWILQYQAKEQERTGIPSLKVAYNKVFGYYIEITNTHAARVPVDYIRKQTVKNAERYLTPELKEYEEKVLGAKERIEALEYDIFLKLRESVSDRLHEIQRAAEIIAELDVFAALAAVADSAAWVRPEMTDAKEILVTAGRHPVLERTLENAVFVPNDLSFAPGTREFLLITGPNMAGKSTYIRQAALLSILGQIGSFVPAKAARLGLVDRVFTRVGASDELSRGNSTFMVEMIETAEILNAATERSLVILDEVGRGTSTFDGLAIAWAIIEHLAQVTRCRALFATHYHQLLALCEELPNAANLCVAVREWQDEIVFLHQIVEGGTDRSYGIHVARLAGLPPVVLRRAEEVLAEVEGAKAEVPTPVIPPFERQLSLFAEPPDPLRQALMALKPEAMTPLEALVQLSELKRLAAES